MAAAISCVKFENNREAFGIGESRPRISWRFAIYENDWQQSAYEIEVLHEATSSNNAPKAEVFSVESSQSQYCPWPSQDLGPGESATIRVRACGGKENLFTPWSEAVTVETGILERLGWKDCYLIEPPNEDVRIIKQPLLFRRTFNLKRSVAKARLYITALGVYEAEINGIRVGDHALSPGWQNYESRLAYQTFDIADHLREGSNAIGVVVGEGWYSGRLGFLGGKKDIWGNKIGLMANLVLTFADGTRESIGTDGEWKYSTGSIVSSGLYDGEEVDFSHDQPGWTTTQFDDGRWESVETRQLPTTIDLASPSGPPVRCTQELKAISISKSPSQKTIVDFGQILVGWVRVKIPQKAQKGVSIDFIHTEVLEHGECATRPLRDAAATDRIVLSGSTDPVEWQPKFTFHGFRYVQVNNWPDLALEDITAIVVHTDMERTGWFDCSDPLINKLHQNIVWSMRGNFLSVPTDCPQRDERLGWTGDLAVFANTGNFLYDTSGMLKDWLQDLESESSATGAPPLVSPNVLNRSASDQKARAIWGDCVVTLPWDLYQAFGDTELVRQKHRSMQLYVDKAIPRDLESGLWMPGFQFGDWLDIAAPADEPGNGNTDPMLVANAFLINLFDIMVQTSQLLGYLEDATRYKEEASRMRKAFAALYITERGRVVADTQTAIALAIQFSLFPLPSQQLTAAARLEEIIKDRYRFKISTGFAGTPILGHALTKVNNNQLFYRMLLHKKNPSWLYPVTMGSTTVWERWNSMLPDGSINEGEMTSFNHYSFGSVADWMHKVIGGLRPGIPGWKEIIIEPIPGGSITFANCAHLTPYGMAKVAWRILELEQTGSWKFQMEVCIPPNSTGRIKLPGEQAFVVVGSGEHKFDVSYETPAWPPIPIYPPFAPHVDDEP